MIFHSSIDIHISIISVAYSLFSFPVHFLHNSFLWEYTHFNTDKKNLYLSLNPVESSTAIDDCQHPPRWRTAWTNPCHGSCRTHSFSNNDFSITHILTSLNLFQANTQWSSYLLHLPSKRTLRSCNRTPICLVVSRTMSPERQRERDRQRIACSLTSRIR